MEFFRSWGRTLASGCVGGSNNCICVRVGGSEKKKNQTGFDMSNFLPKNLALLHVLFVLMI